MPDQQPGRRTAYVFSVNPSGVQRDGLVREGQEVDFKFDTLWNSEIRLRRDGYLALLTIPFKSLRFSAASAQTWGIAFNRVFVRNNESSFWPYITNRKPGFVPQFGELEGLEQIPRNRSQTFVPYLSGGRSRSLGAGGYRDDKDVRGGVDMKYVMRNAYSLDATINPDFSQVESDDPQVTINQRFEVLFPEKRPFFLENASLFSSPINLFFSRRIVDPSAGVRLTGRSGPWAIGVLAADDRASGKRFNSNAAPGDERAVNSVFRLQRDIGSQSRIGFLSTVSQLGSSRNAVFSIDARLRLSSLWFLSAQIARSYDRRANGRTLNGPAYYVDLSRSGQHFTSSTSYLDVSPDFKTSLGFVRRVDIRTATHYMDYYWRPENSRVLSYGPALTVSGIWSRSGRLTDRFYNAEFAMDLKGPIGFRGSRFNGYTYYLGAGFREERTGVSFYDSRLGWLSIYGGFGQGSGINYAPAGELQPFLAKSQDASFGLTARLTPRATLTEYYYYTRLGDPVSPNVAAGLPAGSVFNNHVARSKINYQFTRALSIRAIFDYYAQLPNEALIQDVKFKQITGDILVTYLLNPGTALYLGYTNRYANAAEPGRPDYMPPVILPTTLTGRSAFVKVSYFFRR